MRVPMMARPMTPYAWETTPAEKRPADAEVEYVPLGQVVMTRAVNEVLTEHVSLNELIIDALFRHRGGDWGDVRAEDWKANEDALRLGLRLLSVYTLPGRMAQEIGAPDERLWIITEADRSATTILWPSDY